MGSVTGWVRTSTQVHITLAGQLVGSAFTDGAFAAAAGHGDPAVHPLRGQRLTAGVRVLWVWPAAPVAPDVCMSVDD